MIVTEEDEIQNNNVKLRGSVRHLLITEEDEIQNKNVKLRGTVNELLVTEEDEIENKNYLDSEISQPSPQVSQKVRDVKPRSAVTPQDPISRKPPLYDQQ